MWHNINIRMDRKGVTSMNTEKICGSKVPLSLSIVDVLVFNIYNNIWTIIYSIVDL